MLGQLSVWAWSRFRPATGWLSFFLTLAALACLVLAVVEVHWVPEVQVVAWMAPLGLLLGVVVAGRSLRPSAAWLLLLAYGLLLNLIYLARLWPPLNLLWQGQAAAYIRDNWSIFTDRAGGWLLAVVSGGRSRETIIFALALGLGAWFLSAYTAWATVRQRRPLPALVLLGLSLGLNNYFAAKAANTWAAVLFIGASTMLVAVMHFANQESIWQRQAVDYSPEVRVELLFAAAAVSLMLPLLAFGVPALRLDRLARAFQQTETVQQVEAQLDRTLGGVRRPPRPGFAPGGAGVLPRSYLLGNSPSLRETIVMTATLFPDHPAARNWRAASYDVYTGRGWALSSERKAIQEAGVPLSQPPTRAQTTFTQTVHWLFDRRNTRYTIGLPTQFDEPTVIYWRGIDDFSRAQTAVSRGKYQAVSRLTTAGANDLRQADQLSLPAVIRNRYTNLPEEIPERILQLAGDIAAPYANSYDQALALETFLRQYPYTLDVDAPPANRDPVDYFLFELQRGYCDYYASAMVVMARSLGIPARLATGFKTQQPDENGVQTIYQIHGHAWPELYFGGFGWVEFEPTAGYPSLQTEAMNQAEMAAPGGQQPVTPPPPLPTADRHLLFSPYWLLLLPALALLLWAIWRRRTTPTLITSPVVATYARLLAMAPRLGQPTPPNQTPAEFAAVFLYRLQRWQSHPHLHRWLRPVGPAVERLATLFIRTQYAPAVDPEQHRDETHSLAKTLRPRLWLLWLLASLRRDP